MLDRYSTNPIWATLIAAMAVVGIIIIGYKLLQTRRHVEALQTELERTSARATELEEHAARLSYQREDAVRQRTDLNVPSEASLIQRGLTESERSSLEHAPLNDLAMSLVKNPLDR